MWRGEGGRMAWVRGVCRRSSRRGRLILLLLRPWCCCWCLFYVGALLLAAGCWVKREALYAKLYLIMHGRHCSSIYLCVPLAFVFSGYKMAGMTKDRLSAISSFPSSILSAS